MGRVHACVHTARVQGVDTGRLLSASQPVKVVTRPSIERKRQRMARARRAATKKTSNQTSGGSDNGTLKCPDCGKTFTRAASLGAHRNRAHGVAGASTRARRTRARRGHSNGDGATRRGATTQTTRARSRANPSDGARRGIDRDALLQTLFPNGVPPREAVIRRVNSWLDEAEQLARS